MVARTYGRQWLPLVARDDLRVALAERAAPPANAETLDLVKAGRQVTKG